MLFPVSVLQCDLNLFAGGTYRFRLVAVYSNHDNKHGPNSSPVHLRSGSRRAKAPVTAPFVVEVRPMAPHSISITWQVVYYYLLTLHHRIGLTFSLLSSGSESLISGWFFDDALNTIVLLVYPFFCLNKHC
jgi:hypothetical protein